MRHALINISSSMKLKKSETLIFNVNICAYLHNILCMSFIHINKRDSSSQTFKNIVSSTEQSFIRSGSLCEVFSRIDWSSEEKWWLKKIDEVGVIPIAMLTSQSDRRKHRHGLQNRFSLISVSSADCGGCGLLWVLVLLVLFLC